MAKDPKLLDEMTRITLEFIARPYIASPSFTIENIEYIYRSSNNPWYGVLPPGSQIKIGPKPFGQASFFSLLDEGPCPICGISMLGSGIAVDADGTATCAGCVREWIARRDGVAVLPPVTVAPKPEIPKQIRAFDFDPEDSNA